MTFEKITGIVKQYLVGGLFALIAVGLSIFSFTTTAGGFKRAFREYEELAYFGAFFVQSALFYFSILIALKHGNTLRNVICYLFLALISISGTYVLLFEEHIGQEITAEEITEVKIKLADLRQQGLQNFQAELGEISRQVEEKKTQCDLEKNQGYRVNKAGPGPFWKECEKELAGLTSHQSQVQRRYDEFKKTADQLMANPQADLATLSQAILNLHGLLPKQSEAPLSSSPVRPLLSASTQEQGLFFTAFRRLAQGDTQALFAFAAASLIDLIAFLMAFGVGAETGRWKKEYATCESRKRWFPWQKRLKNYHIPSESWDGLSKIIAPFYADGESIILEHLEKTNALDDGALFYQLPRHAPNTKDMLVQHFFVAGEHLGLFKRFDQPSSHSTAPASSDPMSQLVYSVTPDFVTDFLVKLADLRLEDVVKKLILQWQEEEKQAQAQATAKQAPQTTETSSQAKSSPAPGGQETPKTTVNEATAAKEAPKTKGNGKMPESKADRGAVDGD
jgi:hypothetical protein